MANVIKQTEPTALTKQREAVLQAVRQTNTHPTASEVFASARALLPSISYATVYNSLRYLRDAELIHEISFGNGASRFDSVLTRHDHAICTRCNKLVDLEMELSDELMQLAANRAKFEPHSIQLTLKGLCADCR